MGQERGQFTDMALFCRFLAISLCMVAAGFDSVKKKIKKIIFFFNTNLLGTMNSPMSS